MIDAEEIQKNLNADYIVSAISTSKEFLEKDMAYQIIKTHEYQNDGKPLVKFKNFSGKEY